MNKKLQLSTILAILAIIIMPERLTAQCASNMGFENGNFSGWSTATDSNFITPASRRYIVPGVNMGVINYGGTDMYLGTIARANANVGNRLIKVGNRGVRATADTVYRRYVIDSLSDKLTIYSIGVVELAHNYWGVATVEAPGFGYEIYVNGSKLDCLKGAFFCGNVDQPPVWQLGTFKDTAGVRKSTGWGSETLNFACFVGDTVEVRLFTRDCILLGHYAYAYFDVVCGDTSKPVISQISVNDIIEDDQLDLYCTQDATLYLEPNTDVCPIYRGNIQWTPANFIVGSTTRDSAFIHVPDSVWIYAEAQFSNYCQTITVIDSIYVKYWASDPHDNIPKIDKNYCDCVSDTIDFSDVNVSTIWDNASRTYTLNANDQLIIKPCDNFYEETFWKNPSSRIVTTNSTIGTSSWTSGNSEGAISYDSMSGAGTVRFVINNAVGKSFFVGLNDINSSNNNDMDNAILFNAGNIRAYYQGSNLSNLGTFSGTITVDFEILSNRRVRIWVNGTMLYSYSSGQRINFPYFADFSAQSNFTNQVDKVYLLGPTRNKKDYNRLLNKTTFNYYLNYVDRCGVPVNDTIRYIPGFTSSVVPNLLQCGLNQVNFSVSSSSFIDEISWTTTNGGGNFIAPSGNGSLNSQNVSLGYLPAVPDYTTSPVQVIITSTSGTCSETDTAYLTVNEIPQASAGPDITTTLDTFAIGGAPSGSCSTCGSMSYDWSQGNALSDSTTANPDAYKSQIGAPLFVLRVTDPTTGCFSTDTVYIYTSLSNENNMVETQCINGQHIEFKWLSLPNESIDRYAVEYSLDGGHSWQTSRFIKSNGQMGSVAMPYNMTIERQASPNTIYRWAAINAKGDRLVVENLEQISCSDMPIYQLYPNPFTENLELSIYSENGNKLNYNFEIYNQYGQVVYSKDIRYEESNTSSLVVLDGLNQLSSGVYHFAVKNNGKTLYKTMLVKTN